MSEIPFVNLAALDVRAEGLLPAPRPTPSLFDRRDGEDRRTLGLVPEAIERKASRRGEERRSSPRVARRLWVVDPVEGGIPRVFEGEVGLGGASWLCPFPPLAKDLEIRFRVPEHEEEIKISASLLGVDADDRVRVVFTDVSLRHELALAKYLDDCVSSR